jgi:hypothetical protein
MRDDTKTLLKSLVYCAIVFVAVVILALVLADSVKAIFGG